MGPLLHIAWCRTTHMKKRLNILDCTFRDGGYYNDWDFSPEVVAAYLKACSTSGLSMLELGFRFMPHGRFFGAHAHTTDEFLSSLPLPDNIPIAVMVNAKEMLTHDAGPAAAVDLLFSSRKQSPVTLVRVAVHFSEALESRALVARLKDLGYDVAINLMQAGGKPSAELAHLASKISSWDCVDVLYFADSLGNMDADSVRRTVAALRDAWAAPVGFHAHNNMGQAVINCAAAVESGATWIDGTIAGMGRGAGNAATELILLDFKNRGWNDNFTDPLFHLSIGAFETLRKKHAWGPNLLYHLSASYAIHPTYVQEMLGKGAYDMHHIIDVLEFLKEAGGSAYSDYRLQEALIGGAGTGTGTWSAQGWAKGRDMLVVASGPHTKSHLQALCRYVDRRKPVVVCLNINSVFPADKVTAYAACHKTSLLMDSEHYRSLHRPLVAPLDAIPNPIRSNLKSVEVLDFGMGIKADTFSVKPTGCVIPAPMAAAYALALAEAGGAAKILLAGFDGYPPFDSRHQAMSRMLKCYQSREQAVPVCAVTPTPYEIAKDSIYSPNL